MGIPLPADYQPDGLSMMPALKGEPFDRQKPIFWEWRGGQSEEYTWPSLGVREGDWKLVVDVEGNRYELYNIKEDWKEEVDLAEKNPEKAQQLLKFVEDWKQSLPSEPRENSLSSARSKEKKKVEKQ